VGPLSKALVDYRWCINGCQVYYHLASLLGKVQMSHAGYQPFTRRAADFIDKILGAKPSEIAVEQPRKFELVVNLTTAQAIDRTVPPTLVGPRR
jgi:hypothetical protein